MGVLHRALERTGRLILATEVARGGCLALAALVTAGLLAVALDAVLSLAAWGLVAVDCLLGALAAAALVALAWIAYVNRFEPRWIARLLERRLEVADSALINGVDLADGASPAASEALRRLSLSQSEAMAARLEPSRAANWVELRRAVLAAGLAVAAALAGWALLPGVFRAVLPRLADPRGDHPPFTLLEFTVHVEPRRVYRGRTATIHATLSGQDKLPDQANVVFADDAGGAARPLPMLHAGGGRFLLTIERAERSRPFYVDTPDGRSPLHMLTVHAVPRIESAVARYDYPAYTGWPAAAAMMAGSLPLRALEGTRVTVTVRSNLPLGPSRMVLTGRDANTRQEVVLSPGAEPTEAQGSFRMAFSGRYDLALLSAEGVPGEDRLEGELDCVKDTPPEVELREPPRAVVAPEDWKVPVAVWARDDVRVAQVLIFRGVNGWGPVPAEMPLKQTAPTAAEAVGELDLAALGARPGDIIALHASAADNFPAAPHTADTPTHVIRVIGKMEYLRFARTKQRMEQVEAELDEYGRLLEEIDQTDREMLKEFEELEEKLQAGQELTEQDLARLADLRARQKEQARRMRGLADKLRRRVRQPPLYEFEFDLNESLAALAGDLEALERQTENLAASGDPSGQAAAAKHIRDSAAQLCQGAAGMAQDKQRLKQGQKQAEQLRRADEMVALAEQVAALAQQQRDLADRMGQFRNKEQLSPSEQLRARRLAEEQQQLQKELEESLAGLEKAARNHAQHLPKMSASVGKLASDIRQLNVLRDQAGAAMLAQAGQGRYAHRSADDAATKLESLLKECNGTQGMMERASDDLDRELGLTRQQIGMTLQQLAEGRMLPAQGRQGGAGGGFYGSRAAFTLLGPHVPAGRESDAARGAGRADGGRGTGGAADGGDQRGTERISPEPHRERSGGVRAMPGVPVRYRGLAELYFQRLADESR